MDKWKGSTASALENELQGTWVVLVEQYDGQTADDLMDFSDCNILWKFKRGKSVYIDFAMSLRIDYSYRIEGDLLTLYSDGDEADCTDEQEVYHIVIDGKYAAFWAVGCNDRYVIRAELMKI